jgi:autotransporter-associated beta strand protein
VISGSGSISKSGGGVLTLSGTNTYSGDTTLTSGTLAVGNNSALGTGTLAMAAGTTLSFLTGNFHITNNITLAGDPTFTTLVGSTNTISGVISDAPGPPLVPGEVVIQWRRHAGPVRRQHLFRRHHDLRRYRGEPILRCIRRRQHFAAGCRHGVQHSRAF